MHHNGRCVKDEPYVGLCAKNDKQELIEFEKRKHEKENCNQY